MSFSLLSVVIIGVAAAIIYKQTRKGYKKGLSKSLIDLATLLVCVVASSLISSLLAKLLGKLLFGLLEQADVFSFLEGSLSMLLAVVELLLTMIISVLLYLPVFFLVKFLFTRLVRSISAIILARSRRGIKKKEPQYLSEEAPFYVRHDKKIAAGLGAFTGLILAIVFFMPLTGLLKTSDDIVDTVVDMMDNEELQESEGIQMLDRYANDASGTVLRACGGTVLYDLTANASYEGHSSYINKEIKVIREMNLVDRLKEFQNSGQLVTSNTEMMSVLLDELDDSLCLKIVMVEFIKGASQSWMQYEPYLGISRPDIGNYTAIDDLFDSILFVCSTTTIDTYDADARTIFGLVDVLSEHPAIFNSSDYDVFMGEFVEEGNALDQIEEELYKNPRMNSLNAAVDGLIMNMIATELSALQSGLDAVPVVYDDIADVMNNTRGLDGTVKMSAVSNGVADSFANCDVYLPPVMEGRLASILVSNLSTDEYLTGESVKDHFDGYVRGRDSEE